MTCPCPHPTAAWHFECDDFCISSECARLGCGLGGRSLLGVSFFGGCDGFGGRAVRHVFIAWSVLSIMSRNMSLLFTWWSGSDVRVCSCMRACGCVRFHNVKQWAAVRTPCVRSAGPYLCNNAHFATVLHRKRSHSKFCPDCALCSCGSCAAHSKSRSDKRSALLAQRTISNRHFKQRQKVTNSSAGDFITFTKQAEESSMLMERFMEKKE
jgi:hypothetical protein